jgi:hypothetical protein
MFDRERVRGWLEDSLNRTFGISDSSADTLIAQAESLGLTPEQLRLWIYDQVKVDWTPGALARWAWKEGFAQEPGGLKRAAAPAIPEEPEAS